MNGEMAAALKFPFVFFVDLDPHQVRHDLTQTPVMIAFHPHNLDAALRIREFADVAQKLPVGLGEAAKIQVGENVAQQDQAAEAGLPQHPRGLLRAADLRSQVQVRDDERVINGGTHHPSCNKRMLRVDENCTEKRAMVARQSASAFSLELNTEY